MPFELITAAEEVTISSSLEEIKTCRASQDEANSLAAVILYKYFCWGSSRFGNKATLLVIEYCLRIIVTPSRNYI